MSMNAVAPSHIPVLEIVCGFDLAPAALIEARSLQRRVDRKYLLGADTLDRLLSRLRHSHCVLRAGQQVWARYESLYFDTPDRLLYHTHRCGRRPRYKVRIRRHIDRELSFLEIKRKENSGRTVKRRLALPYSQTDLGSRERTFIESHTPLHGTGLFPRVSISFRRLTLLGSDINERVTFDRDLTVVVGTRAEQLARIVIAEVKQSCHVNHSGAVAAFRGLNVREEALSKYCLATILVAPVRANIFKPALKAIERLSA